MIAVFVFDNRSPCITHGSFRLRLKWCSIESTHIGLCCAISNITKQQCLARNPRRRPLLLRAVLSQHLSLTLCRIVCRECFLNGVAGNGDPLAAITLRCCHRRAKLIHSNTRCNTCNDRNSNKDGTHPYVQRFSLPWNVFPFIRSNSPAFFPIAGHH